VIRQQYKRTEPPGGLQNIAPEGLCYCRVTKTLRERTPRLGESDAIHYAPYTARSALIVSRPKGTTV